MNLKNDMEEIVINKKNKKMVVVLAPGDLVANRIHLLLEFFESIGYILEIHVISRKEISVYYKTDFSVTHNIIQSKIFKLPKVGVILFRLFGPITLLRKRIKNNDSLFVSNSDNLPLLFFGKFFSNCATYYDQREMFTFGTGRNLKPLIRLWLDLWERIFVKWVDIVFTVDSHKNIWIDRYKKIGKKSLVIKNVPSKKAINLEIIKKKIKNRRFDGLIHLVIVGGIIPNQGIEKVLTALKFIPHKSFMVHLIGRIDQQYIESLQALIQENSIDSCLEAVNWMDYSSLVSYISRFHIGFLVRDPSVGQYGWTGIGNSRKPYTYMQAGIPVIAPNKRSVALQVEQEDCGFRVDVQNPLAIARTIEKLIEDSELYFKMAYNGIDAVDNKYNWENEVQKIIRFI